MLRNGICYRCKRSDVINERGKCLDCMSPEELEIANREADHQLLVIAILICGIILAVKLLVSV